MTERSALRFVVARVIPDLISNEPVNVGVIVHDAKTGQVRVQFTQSLSKLQTYADENINIDALRFVVEGIEDGVHAEASDASLLERLCDKYQNQLQFAGPLGALSASIDEELESLYTRYVTIDRMGRHTKRGVTHRSLATLVGRAFRTYNVPVMTNQVLRGVKADYRFDFLFDNGLRHAMQCFSFGVPDNAAQVTTDAKAFAYSVGDIVRLQHETGGPKHGFTALTYPPASGPSHSEYKTSVAILGEVANVIDASQELDGYAKSLAELPVRH
jgi:hypothetical protein